MPYQPPPQPLQPSHIDIPPPEALADTSALAALLSASAPNQDRLEERQRASPNPAIREALAQAQVGVDEGEGSGGLVGGERRVRVQDWGRGRVGEDGFLEETREIAADPPSQPGFAISSPVVSSSSSSSSSSSAATGQEARAGPLQPEDHQPRVFPGGEGRVGGGGRLQQPSFGGLGNRGEGR